MTCNHVLPTKLASQKSTLFFGRVSEEQPGTKIEGLEVLDTQYFLTDDEEVRLHDLRMWDMPAASSVCLFQREPCAFITFFSVTVVMHVTACDVRVIRKTNCTTTQESQTNLLQS